MNESMTGDGRYLKHHPLFSNLSGDDLEMIRKVAKLHILRRGAKMVIDRVVSNRIYFLVSGKIKIADTPEGSDKQIKDVLYPGEMFGNIFLNGDYSEEFAESLQHNTLVYCFSVTDFRKLLRTCHPLALNYAEQLSRKLQLLKERYAIWTRHDTRTRLVYLLFKWAVHEGKHAQDTVVLENFPAITDLADILTVSRQFLHQLLKEMHEAGLLTIYRKRIELKRSLIEEVAVYVND